MLLLTIMASIINFTTKKVTQNNSTVCVVELGLWCEEAQTNRIDHRQWCGDDTYPLTLGILMTHTMVRPKPLNAMVAEKNGNNLFTNRCFAPGMKVRRILYNFQHANK